jgi:hypothetical protein
MHSIIYAIICSVLSKYFTTANSKESNIMYVFTVVLYIQQLI